jgi:DNA repair photolyase
MRSRYREEPCKSALNPVRGMGFRWTLNPYMGCEHRCAFCYVRFYERRADRPSDVLYGEQIRVKTNVAEVLREELSRPSWRRELVAVGGATDPYQPAEAHYRLTRSCLAALGRARTPFQIITRAPLIARDLDVLQEASRRAEVSVSFSIPTLDEAIWRRTEPRAPHPRERLKALRRLVEGGVRAGVGVAPILPGLSDDPGRLEAVVRAARHAGAAFVWAEVLHLREGTREHFLQVLEREWPELLSRYENLYATRAYLPEAQKRPALEVVASLRRRLGITDRRLDPLRPPPEPEQLALLP